MRYRGPPVTIGVDGVGHALIGGAVGQQEQEFPRDGLAVGADQRAVPGLDRPQGAQWCRASPAQACPGSGASSWIPPESVITTSTAFMRCTKGR